MQPVITTYPLIIYYYLDIYCRRSDIYQNTKVSTTSSNSANIRWVRSNILLIATGGGHLMSIWVDFEEL